MENVDQGLSVSANRSRYQTTLRCFPFHTGGVERTGKREGISLTGKYTGAERK